jgi:hypothetical protein
MLWKRHFIDGTNVPPGVLLRLLVQATIKYGEQPCFFNMRGFELGLNFIPLYLTR